jgi:hypothetical protein
MKKAKRETRNAIFIHTRGTRALALVSGLSLSTPRYLVESCWFLYLSFVVFICYLLFIICYLASRLIYYQGINIQLFGIKGASHGERGVACPSSSSLHNCQLPFALDILPLHSLPSHTTASFPKPP